jgi:D-3-phosphoglycerate dehydrogenase
MAKIIVLDNLSQDGLDLLESTPGIEYEVRTGLKGQELQDALKDFDGAICRSGVKITAESLEGNKRLRAIARAGVGTDNIDKVAATRGGIIVMNTPGGNTLSTAEQTLALMLAMSRNLYPAYQSLLEGRWDRKKFMGSQVAGKTLGIIGMGRIGQAVAKRAKAMEMAIVAYDPFLPAARATEMGIALVESPQDLLPEVDYLTVHTPLNDSTRGLIGKKEIEMIKPGARLINCARGGIFDRDALVEGLESGKLGGVALDVYEEEPCTDHPIFGMPNVICTPHLGASTEEAQTNVAVEAAQLLIDFFATGAIRQAVNFSPLEPEMLESIRGHLDVAYRLGMLQAQLNGAPPTACKMKYRGEVCSKDTSLLSASFAAGLLTGAMEEEVSIISALALLQERGIELVEEKTTDKGDFSSTISAEIVTEGGTTSACGTLFGNRMPRLVQKDGCRLESYLDGNLLVFLHRDLPGVIGSVGNVFGKYDTNIAHMSVGRSNEAQPGGEAIGVLSLDSQPPQEAIDQLLEHEHISKVWLVKLPAAGERPAWMM